MSHPPETARRPRPINIAAVEDAGHHQPSASCACRPERGRYVELGSGADVILHAFPQVRVRRMGPTP